MTRTINIRTRIVLFQLSVIRTGTKFNKLQFFIIVVYVLIPFIPHLFRSFFRDIWKFCAWQLTEKSVCSTMWKAIIGAFCGNLSVLLPACKKWEDLLWAYMRVYIDVKVEEEIRSKGLRSYVELPDQYWDFKFVFVPSFFIFFRLRDDKMIRLLLG
jgi:hypothetical protein